VKFDRCIGAESWRRQASDAAGHERQNPAWAEKIRVE
jgi:hypothetical protein